MAIFNSYVTLPEGKSQFCGMPDMRQTHILLHGAAVLKMEVSIYKDGIIVLQGVIPICLEMQRI
jgi:hypothetical protein